MARYAAKNVVAAGLAKKCEIQLSYAIGVAKPTSVFVDTFGTGTIPDDELCKMITDTVDFRPTAILAQLELRKPFFSKTSVYGHFGKPLADLTWERTDKASMLRRRD